MHSKQKGNIGQTATILSLQKQRWNVFLEMGDYSKIDIIAEKEGRLVKIQVKYCKYHEERGIYILPMRKSGPNGYRYNYQDIDFDVFAVYLPDTFEVIFIHKNEIDSISSFTLRKNQARNNQKNSCHFISNYSGLDEVFLRS